MFQFRNWKLRRKFLAISVLAALPPVLLFTILPLKFFFSSFREIEEGLLQSELRSVEALLRKKRETLEGVARLIADSDWSGGLTDPETSSPLPQIPDWSSFLKSTYGIDFAFLSQKGEALEVLAGPEKEVREGCLNAVEWFDRRGSGASEASGIYQMEDRSCLLAISARSDDRLSPDSQEWRIGLGVFLDSSIVSELSGMTQTEVSFSTLPVRANASGDSGMKILRNSNDTVSIRKPVRDLENQPRFEISVTAQRGLFNRVESNQLWFFVFFISASSIAAFFGTASAATLILKPLGKLHRMMSSVRGPGEYKTRAPVGGRDEIGELAISYNRLMQRLEVAQRELDIAQRHAIEAERLGTLHATVLTLSHEINNPLTSVMGMAEMLLMDDRLDQDQRDSVQVIRRMALRISEVIQKLQKLDDVETTTYIDFQKMIRLEPKERARVA